MRILPLKRDWNTSTVPQSLTLKRSCMLSFCGDTLALRPRIGLLVYMNTGPRVKYCLRESTRLCIHQVLYVKD